LDTDSLFATRYSLFATRCSLLAVRYWITSVVCSTVTGVTNRTT
jgi:hypothetical protein